MTDRIDDDDKQPPPAAAAAPLYARSGVVDDEDNEFDDFDDASSEEEDAPPPPPVAAAARAVPSVVSVLVTSELGTMVHWSGARDWNPWRPSRHIRRSKRLFDQEKERQRLEGEEMDTESVVAESERFAAALQAQFEAGKLYYADVLQEMKHRRRAQDDGDDDEIDEEVDSESDEEVVESEHRAQDDGDDAIDEEVESAKRKGQYTSSSSS